MRSLIWRDEGPNLLARLWHRDVLPPCVLSVYMRITKDSGQRIKIHREILPKVTCLDLAEPTNPVRSGSNTCSPTCRFSICPPNKGSISQGIYCSPGIKRVKCIVNVQFCINLFGDCKIIN